MEDRRESTAFAAVESLTGWWNLAGLDSVVSETAVNWLADDNINISQSAAPVAVSAVNPSAVPAAPMIAWPDDVATLRFMVSDGAPLPGNGYGPVRFPSIGPDHCDVMVIADLPDISFAPDIATSANAALLHRMLAAIGIEATACYCTWLATSMPSTAEVPEEDLPDLAAFMLHQIKLVKPQYLVILGASACKALLREELMIARTELRSIHHDSRNITTLATFHPRTLIARPAMKKQAWRDLQLFAKRAVP
jgi:uracil-DNA glycosylase